MRTNNFNFIFVMALLTFLSVACGENSKQPEWQNAKILAENVDHPAAIVSDDLFIYYVTGGTIASLNEGTSGVWRKPIAGGEPVQLFKGHYIDKDKVILPDFFVLAIDEKYVYWSSGEIWKTPKMGGESIKITNGSPTKLVLDDEKIYWQNFIGENGPPQPIYFCDKKGGEPKALTEPAIASGIVVDKENLFWAQRDGIYKISKNGGEKTKVYSATENQNISGLIADKENFYLAQGDGRNALYKVSKNGGEAVKIAPSLNHAYNFYADGTNVYFITDEGSTGSSLNKVSKNGGEVVKIASGYSSSFTIGKDGIFVTDISKIYELKK